jgi:hypothetical protein
MNEDLRLTISWESFSQELKKKIEHAEDLMKRKNNIKTENDLEDLKAGIKSWSEEGHAFLKQAFTVERHQYENDFRNARKHRFDPPNKDKSLEQRLRETLEDLQIKKNDLWGTERILSVCDYTINKNNYVLSERKKYSTEEKLEFLLSKLYDLYDENSYPIRLIFVGNGIPLFTSYEDRELATFLEQGGYISFSNGPAGLSAQLTINGRLYVEEKRKSFTEDYNNINVSSEELNEKIDQVIYELKKQGLGQEILYNEIEELKALYLKLNKKNWGQLLKGKLVDIGLSQMVDKDVLKVIYEKITSQELHLPA